MKRILTVFFLIFTACGEGDDGDETAAPTNTDAELFAVGDSFLDFHDADDAPFVAGDRLGRSVTNAAVSGETMLGGGSRAIPAQVIDGPYAWLIASGGGNDLAECTCGVDCEPVVDALIAADGTGAIPTLVSRVTTAGAGVVWAGYFRPLPDAEQFTNCEAELATLQTRLNALDDASDDVVFVDGSLIGNGTDASMYAPDGYHPSVAGSRALGEAIADAILAAEE